MKTKQSTLTRVAIMVDGGFFLKRFNKLYNREQTMSASEIADVLYWISMKHVGQDNLYRIFYYDCNPMSDKFTNPISKRTVDFKKSDTYKFKEAFFDSLRRKRKVALRLGELKTSKKWVIKSDKTKDLLSGKISVSDLTPDDVALDIRQKGIDMKIGVDITSLALKRYVDKIVLISGDADFVPASKFARREGIDFVLDSMFARIDPQLYEHIDGLKTFRPSIKPKE